ncbi:beta-galactosidase [Streptomyces sp. E-08]|uniref:beta-galactosidase n=1 Tax=Streptomyces sp. E-08 TaxID=3404047 RepID=UPI003CF773A9
MPRLEIAADGFRLDGRPFRIIPGGLHSFRVHPEQWTDRLHKARLLGLNTVETYVPWNRHAPRRGEFRADGGLDLPHFHGTARPVLRIRPARDDPPGRRPHRAPRRGGARPGPSTRPRPRSAGPSTADTWTSPARPTASSPWTAGPRA